MCVVYNGDTVPIHNICFVQDRTCQSMMPKGCIVIVESGSVRGIGGTGTGVMEEALASFSSNMPMPQADKPNNWAHFVQMIIKMECAMPMTQWAGTLCFHHPSGNLWHSDLYSICIHHAGGAGPQHFPLVIRIYHYRSSYFQMLGCHLALIRSLLLHAPSHSPSPLPSTLVRPHDLFHKPCNWCVYRHVIVFNPRSLQQRGAKAFHAWCGCCAWQCHDHCQDQGS